MPSPIPRLFRRLRPGSLSRKLLLPIVGLMLLSLLGSTIAFVVGTALTQSRLLQQQSGVEAGRVEDALESRVESVGTAAALLANDPEVVGALQGEGTEALQTLHSRAVIVRDRFDLDLIQVYDAQGAPRVNLLISTLYRESSLLDEVVSSGPALQVVDGHLLLLARSPIAEGEGTVLVGLDMASELNRIVRSYRLSSELGLTFEGTGLATREDLPLEAPAGRSHGLYVQRRPLELGESTTDLLLARTTVEAGRVTRTGLVVMVGSTVVTTLFLIGVSAALTRSISRPIHELAEAAQRVAKGDLDQGVDLNHLPSAFGVGRDDEIGLLATTFDDMVAELRGLYVGLEDEVEARTRELKVVADVTRAVSASLDLDVVLRTAVEVIQERLELYYVGVFLVEPETNMIILREGAGGDARSLVDEVFGLKVGSKSLVGLAAATGEARVVQDVGVEPLYLRHHRLPHTASEAVIPLLVEGNVVGVLDVQRTRKDGFSPDLVNLLHTLTDQITVGVQNTRLYTAQRQTAEHLAEVDRMKTQFLANMSHELRTPLNSIIGFSKFMLKGLEGPLTPGQEEELTIIHNSGQHLLALINDVLDISKINAGKLVLSFDEVDLYELVEDVRATVVALINDKPVVLVSKVDPALPMVRGDPRRVRQILLNLLSNAAKFTEEGVIEVHARLVDALNSRTRRVEPFVEVAVEDTGVGIPRGKLREIFKEFTQVDDSDSRSAGGTGLGLPITKKLVSMHDGHIWVESEVGRGSCFTFTLPVYRQGVESFTLEEEEKCTTS